MPQAIESIAKGLYYVFETCALTGCAEEYGFQDLYVPLRDQRNAEIIAGLKVLGSALAESKGTDIVESLASFCSDFYVPGKIMQAVGGVLGVMRSEVKIVQRVEAICAIAGENHGLSNAAEDLSFTIQKMEEVTKSKVLQQTAVKLIDAEKQLEKGPGQKILVNARAMKKQVDAVDHQESLQKKLSSLQAAQQEAVKVKNLPDGRIRYYKKESPAKVFGKTRGRSQVVEFNPETGSVRGWSECYDHDGNVNRVNPKFINGQDILGQHYPPTYVDLQNMAKQRN